MVSNTGFASPAPALLENDKSSNKQQLNSFLSESIGNKNEKVISETSQLVN